MGEISSQTNAMTAAMQGMSMGKDPAQVLKKRLRPKQNYGMSTLKNQNMPKKAKQVYTPVYERPPKASPRNALAVQIYESMFYNKQRIGVTHGQFRGLQQKIMTAPDEAMSATETIIERLVESGAGEENGRGPGRPGLGAAASRFASAGLKVSRVLARRGVKAVVVSLRQLGKHVFVPGSSGRALIALAVMFALRATAMVAYDLSASSGTDTDPSANLSTWTQWVGSLWQSATANPIRDGSGLFKSTGLTEKYTSFLASFWGNSTSELNEFWKNLPPDEFSNLRKFMEHREIGTTSQNTAAFTDISQLVRYAFISTEENNNAPEALKPVIKELQNLAKDSSFKFEVTKEIDGALRSQVLEVENPFKEQLSGLAGLSAGAQRKDGGQLLEAQFAIESQGSTWSLLATRFALSLARIGLRGSGVQQTMTDAVKKNWKSWLSYLPGIPSEGPLMNAMVKLLAGSDKVVRWEEYDKMFMICATVTVYTIWNFLRQCMDINRRYIKGVAPDGKTPMPPASRGEKIVSFSNFTQSLTMMVASMSMLYTVLTVGPVYLATTGITPTSTANFFFTNITAMLVEESVLFTMGYKSELSGGMFLLNKTALAFVGVMLNVYLEGQWTWVVNSGLVALGAVGVTAGRYIWNTAMASTEGWRKQVATLWRGVKLNPGTYLFDSMGEWMINTADEWEKVYLDVPEGNGGFQNAAQALLRTGPAPGGFAGTPPGPTSNATPAGQKPKMPLIYANESPESIQAKRSAYAAELEAYYAQKPSQRPAGPATTTEDRVKAAQQAREQAAAAQQRTKDLAQLGAPGQDAISALERFTLGAQDALNNKNSNEPTLADKVVEKGQKKVEQVQQNVRNSVQGAMKTFDSMFAESQPNPTSLSRFQQLAQQSAQQSAQQDPNLQAEIAQAEQELRRVLPANQFAGRAADQRDQIRRRGPRANQQSPIVFQAPNFDSPPAADQQPPIVFQAPNFNIPT